ncbi:MAG: hypothetical protein HOO86_10635 [Bacteroidales bacterium]|nr:hypothetical protein [Bacteroidales bacterium]
MKRLNIKLPIVLIALALGFSSCQKDNASISATDNTTAGIKLQALHKSFPLPVNNSRDKSTSAVTASLLWDTARMIVSSVKFEAELKSVLTHHDSIEIEYKWNGPLEVDLFDSTIALGNLLLQPGFYDEIEIKVVGSKEDAGNSSVFYLHGFYTGIDSTTLPVMVIVNESVMFKTERDSVEITASDISIFSSTIELYLDQLMADVQPSALDDATLTDGMIVISEDSNTELYALIMQNLRKDHHCEHGHGHGNGHGH